jgi:hypothetical protein
MAGRGPQTFKKRQKEQARKEKQLEKRAKKLERKQGGPEGENPEAEEDFSDYTGGHAHEDELTVNHDAVAGIEREQR